MKQKERFRQLFYVISAFEYDCTVCPHKLRIERRSARAARRKTNRRGFSVLSFPFETRHSFGMSSGSRSPSPWGQGGSRQSNATVGSPPPASSLSSFSPTSPQSLEPSPASSQTSLKVHSTSPPSKPQLPPSPRTAQPITPSILLNPLPASHRSNSPPSASTSLLKRLPGKRRQSLVTVEVHHSPPPAHFYQSQELEHSREDLQEDEEEERVGRSTNKINQTTSTTNPYSYNMSPPRPDFSGMRSRSASPISSTPRSASPIHHTSSQFLSPTSTSPTSTTSSTSPSSSSFVPLTSIISNRSTSSQASTSTTSNGSNANCIRFAPLPQGKRPNRSNSISLGVASRARMINAQGGQPNVQQARYAGQFSPLFSLFLMICFD